MFNERQLARLLGLVSIALGAVYVLAPGPFTRWLGVRPTTRRSAVVAMVGARELIAGGGLLVERRPSRWLWARVAGDAKDLLLLAAALRLRGTQRRRVGAAMAAIAGITAVDVLAAAAMRIRRKSDAGGADEDSLRVEKSLTIQRPAHDLYQFWRDFENLPRFMAHLESVDVLDDRRSNWRAHAPLGKIVEWTAEITEDSPGEVIAWRTLAGSDVASSGRVRFDTAPGGDATEVRVAMEYVPPAGAVGAAVARLAGQEPSQQVAGDLRRFKQVMETGDVVQSDAIIGNRGLKQNPAQPPADGQNGGTR